jgi:hypothetical protein
MSTLHRQKGSRPLMQDVCGMGRLPKIVTTRNALVLEFNTASDGLMANTGFLFYAMSTKKYFESYNIIDMNEISKIFGINKNVQDGAKQEMKAIEVIERLQVENCNSDMANCYIQINDEIMEQQIGNRLKAERFHIGYLFGMNQYHPKSFTLKYILKTEKFNTIAIFLNRYQPQSKLIRFFSFNKI